MLDVPALRGAKKVFSFVKVGPSSIHSQPGVEDTARCWYLCTGAVLQYNLYGTDCRFSRDIPACGCRL